MSIMHKYLRKLSKDLETFKKNHTETLELKNSLYSIGHPYPDIGDLYFLF